MSPPHETARSTPRNWDEHLQEDHTSSPICRPSKTHHNREAPWPRRPFIVCALDFPAATSGDEEGRGREKGCRWEGARVIPNRPWSDARDAYEFYATFSRKKKEFYPTFYLQLYAIY